MKIKFKFNIYNQSSVLQIHNQIIQMSNISYQLYNIEFFNTHKLTKIKFYSTNSLDLLILTDFRFS